LRNQKKLAWIDNVHANTFHLVKIIVKIGPVDPEMALVNLKKSFAMAEGPCDALVSIEKLAMNECS